MKPRTRLNEAYHKRQATGEALSAAIVCALWAFIGWFYFGHLDMLGHIVAVYYTK